MQESWMAGEGMLGGKCLLVKMRGKYNVFLSEIVLHFFSESSQMLGQEEAKQVFMEG